ncbi:hypothetical protein [Pseudomonas citronellolis]|uniref:hypothetical protein n=1 Tax=Pseudomonas citronellolis TaxID=53408 RepID=UPI0022BA1E6D|nr:hypothetical protein [Pseudomonas citronellolis]
MSISNSLASTPACAGTLTTSNAPAQIPIPPSAEILRIKNLLKSDKGGNCHPINSVPTKFSATGEYLVPKPGQILVFRILQNGFRRRPDMNKQSIKSPCSPYESRIHILFGEGVFTRSGYIGEREIPSILKVKNPAIFGRMKVRSTL